MDDAFTDRLSDYLDDEDLDAAERREIEAHVAVCAACRQTLAELRAVSMQARGLTDTLPAADLWPALEARLSRVRLLPFTARRFTFTLPQLAAAALALMVLSGGLVWITRVGGTRTDVTPLGAQTAAGAPSAAAAVAPTPANFADEQYDAAVRDLERALALGRGSLDPETVRVLEANLVAIDRAIEESRRALEQDPANAYLNAHLARFLQRKLALLRRATALTADGLSS
jgi:anti-sigma factor RsiW